MMHLQQQRQHPSFLPCTSDVQGKAVGVEDFIQIPTLPSQHRLVLVLFMAFSSSHRLLQQDWTKLGFNFLVSHGRLKDSKLFPKAGLVVYWTANECQMQNRRGRHQCQIHSPVEEYHLECQIHSLLEEDDLWPHTHSQTSVQEWSDCGSQKFALSVQVELADCGSLPSSPAAFFSCWMT